MLEALKGRDASLTSEHVAPLFPGVPDTGTCVPRAGLPGREAKQLIRLTQTSPIWLLF